MLFLFHIIITEQKYTTILAMRKGLFIFHRDLRIHDNIGLIEAAKKCEVLYTCFIFTPEQVGPKNEYRSANAIQFMIESLAELAEEIKEMGGKLLLFHGSQTAVLKHCIQVLELDGIFFNKDYTPYAVQRDKDAAELCAQQKIACEMFADYYLFEPGTVTTGGGSGEAYKKYTPFYEATIRRPVNKPRTSIVHFLIKPTKKLEHETTLAAMKIGSPNPDILVHGGRGPGLARLRLALREQARYDDTRDHFKNRTTHLSAYIKFGCVSIREVYHAIKRRFGLHHGLIRELLWREFFAHVLFSYPDVLGPSYQPRYRHLSWSKSTTAFEKWTQGKTGFPLVDAAMRELNTTGYMHNRGRMTVASFLVKTLLIDWRWGEKYFAQHLTDYDIASNNGGWQGISGTGVDMKPYFRDMNPWIQSAKFDRDAEYIKRWLPELAKVEPRDIHQWHTAHENNKGIDYPAPMVDYDEQKKKMLALYRSA